MTQAFRAVVLNIVIVLLSLLSFSCAAKLPYSLDYPLSQEIFRSHDGMFIGLIPLGWFSASEDTLASAQLAWLVKDDFSAVLTLHELHPERLAFSRVQKEGLTLLAYISLTMHRDDTASTINVQPKEFPMSGNQFCGYEITSSGKQKRVVVFVIGGRFYESEAVPIKGTWGQKETEKLFMAQAAFLASLVF